MIMPYIWGWGGSSKGTAFWGWAEMILHDKDAVKFTLSERQNKAIPAGFIPKVIGISTTVKAVKR